MDPKIQEKVRLFFLQFRNLSFKKGEILIRAEDNPQGIYYILKGVVRQYAISRKGDYLVVNIFKEHAFFPMSWAINGTDNMYYYEAAMDVDVQKAPKEQVLEFIKKNPEVLYDLLSRVYSGTDGLLMRLFYLMSADAYSRLIAELIIQGRRFGKATTQVGSIEINVSEKDLASQTGMTRETVSRVMKTLKEKDLVRFNTNTLIINDIVKLEEELKNL